jgi:hypothetical protein
MAEPLPDAGPVPLPFRRPTSADRLDRLDAGLARMAGRLAGVLDLVGDDAGARFLRGLPGSTAAPAADGGCLDLPTGARQPVDRLVAGLALGPTDRDLLLLALLGHHHEGIPAVLRGLHPAGRPWPTVGLAATLAERGALGDLGSRAALRTALATGPLVATGAVRVGPVDGEPPDVPFPDRTVTPAPGLWEALTGLDTWPDGVAPDPRPTPDWGLAGWLAEPAVGAARRAVARGSVVAVSLSGARPGALAARLVALVAAAGRAPVLLRCHRLDAPTAGAVLVAALARGVVPVLTTDAPADRVPASPGVPVPLLLAAPEPAPDTWPRPRIDLPAGPLAPADRRAALAAALPELGAPARPLGPATLEPGDLALAVADLRAAGPPDWDALAQRVDARTADTVPAGAVLVHPRATWADLVLPVDRLAQLHEAVDRMRAHDRVLRDWGLGRGRPGQRGLRLLFAGPPGTGKTLAAEVVAAALGRDLLVVDLSQLVSKWLGETEKNLAAVFDAAERGGAALLFDEADALFGRRTEVGDARDRYANLETAYLLGRLERFDGVAVLATNLRQNMDVAFARRLEFVVGFDRPDEAARLALWRTHLPPSAPLATDVDLAAVAALYELSGALIRNAAMAAAFLAAAEPVPADRVVGAAHLTHAIRREHVKAGLSFPGPVPGAPADLPSRREPT